MPGPQRGTTAGGGRDDAPAVAQGDLFSPVTVSRVSQVIVEQVRLLLRQGRLRPGDRLPSERELCERFGVSRVTVREALRVLEANGLIEIRVGARGGAFVTSPTSQQVGAGLADLLSLSPLTAAEVTEARLVFEIGIIPLIVERATADDIAELRALNDAQQRAHDDGTYTMEMSADFHIRLAAATHNAAIETLVQSFHGPLLMSLVTAKLKEPVMGKVGTREHRDFIDAVEARGVANAESIMRAPLRRTADRVAKDS
ncbi:MAG: GntR family transcriptional regulator [Streptosporangiales bacterium]|nr:GntR family transcriptional regulator [Streptosporangiales bacterium]